MTTGVLTVAAVSKSPGLPAELPAVLMDNVSVVPDTVKVVPAAMFAGVVSSTKYMPLTSPVAELTVIDPAPELKIDLNVVIRGVTVTEEI